MNSTLVSIVMPAYNTEKYIKEAIESILNQTFIDFEFIIINDGSIDETFAIIQSFKDHRIKYFENESNKGFSNTLNYGISLASGKYIARMDSDDIAMPNRIQKQFEFMENNPDISILGTNYIRMDNNINIYHPIDYESLKIALIEETGFAHPTVMMRKADIISLNLFYKKDYVPAEDYKFWTDAAMKKLKLANLADILLRYRIHNTQMSTSLLRLSASVKRIREEYAIFYGESTLSEDELSIIGDKFQCASLSDCINIVYKLRSINKKRSFFRKKDFSHFLWSKISLALGKHDLKMYLRYGNYDFEFKMWLLKNYGLKVVSNILGVNKSDKQIAT